MKTKLLAMAIGMAVNIASTTIDIRTLFAIVMVVAALTFIGVTSVCMIKRRAW